MKQVVDQLKIGIVGLGHVGLTLAAHLTKGSSKIFGYEDDIESVRKIVSGNFSVHEPGLSSIIESALKQKNFILNDYSVDDLDALFVSVGTPNPTLETSDRLHFSLLEKCVEESSRLIKKGGVLFLRSTVAIGTTRQVERNLGQIGRGDILTCFAPERTAEGVALKELDALPQLFGANSELSKKFGNYCLTQLGFKTVQVDSTEIAELAKLICNTWRDTTFAFANEIAMLGDLLGINAQEAIKAANEGYERSNIPSPGPVSGPCLSKDTYILHQNIPQSEYSVTLSSRKVNESFEQHVIQIIVKQLNANSYLKRVVVAGLAFKGKPTTYDTRDSIGIAISSHLIENHKNIQTSIWEEQVPISLLDGDLHFVLGPEELISSDVIILANNASFLTSKWLYLAISKNPNLVIIDVWGVLPEEYRSQINYKLVGDGYGP